MDSTTQLEQVLTVSEVARRYDLAERTITIACEEGRVTARKTDRVWLIWQPDAQRGKCWWCGEPVEWDKRHDDPLIPLSRGGTNYPNNMVVSCAFCNLSKNDQTPDEFSGRLF